jgi:hypothetical protein
MCISAIQLYGHSGAKIYVAQIPYTYSYACLVCLSEFPQTSVTGATLIFPLAGQESRRNPETLKSFFVTKSMNNFERSD